MALSIALFHEDYRQIDHFPADDRSIGMIIIIIMTMTVDYDEKTKQLTAHWPFFGVTQITFMSGAKSVARHFVSVEMPAFDIQ